MAYRIVTGRDPVWRDDQRRVWDCQNAADELVAVDVRWDLAEGTLRENPQVDEILRRYAHRR